MLRISLILGPFALAIAGLVFLQTGLLAPDTNPREAGAAQPMLQLTDVTDVVARLPADEHAAIANPSAALATPENPEMQALTNSILAGLGVQPSPTPAAPQAGGEMRMLTSAVLASLGGQPATAPETSDEPGISQLVSEALGHGQSDSYIDELLNEAADKGLIAVPPALRTSEGRVDTTTLISELARAASGEAARVPAALVIASGPGVEVRVVQELGRTVQHNFYTVQKGDSLGAIAHKFYGDAALFTGIFEANRRLLSSPDRIKAGQRLNIPALSST